MAPPLDAPNEGRRTHIAPRGQPFSELAHLIRREDIPRLPHRLPRPLTAEQDQLLQQELIRRNDLGGNAFLLIRHTGMRIGECADLSSDCLRSTGPDQWAVHVPLGKLKTERMVPVDPFVCGIIRRLRFSLPRSAACRWTATGPSAHQGSAGVTRQVLGEFQLPALAPTPFQRPTLQLG